MVPSGSSMSSVGCSALASFAPSQLQLPLDGSALHRLKISLESPLRIRADSNSAGVAVWEKRLAEAAAAAAIVGLKLRAEDPSALSHISPVYQDTRPLPKISAEVAPILNASALSTRKTS
mmetsp:Transcript_7177/g.13038  ORF Transcript_7177/g.13038 Transcript_7177/m.13038 type:complete len:120 (+) Transcript_7177:1074-1433(+)